MAKTTPFSERCVALLTPLGPVRSRAMFGGFGIFLDDLMFALVAWDRLFFRVDDQTRGRFVEAGSEAFTYSANGRAMTMAYFEAPEGSLADSEALLPWAELGLAAAQRNRKKSPKTKRRNR
jgi:DNA transformation protein